MPFPARTPLDVPTFAEHVADVFGWSHEQANRVIAEFLLDSEAGRSLRAARPEREHVVTAPNWMLLLAGMQRSG